MSWLAIIAGGMLGLIVGSFIATACLRWPRGEQVLLGRSRCDGCRMTLGARDLVPVVSAALAGGRCRGCGVRIDPFHGHVELAAAALGAAAMALSPDAAGAALALFCWLLLPLAILDARHFWLPDVLTALLGLAGLGAGHLLADASLADRLIGGVVGFAALTLIAATYRRVRGVDGLGAGDAKLLGAIGLWTGWAALAPILFLASATGLGIAAARGKSARAMMPFGALLAIGAAAWAAFAAAGIPLLR